ncbi:MAG: type II secretion system F family protein [Armatimonadota bacterium]
MITQMKKETKEKLTSLFKAKKKVPLKEMAIFTRQMSTLLSSGIHIASAIDVLMAQTDNKRLLEVTEDIKLRILAQGASFSQALSYHRDVFSSLYIATVKCGETSGSLPEAMVKLARELEEDVKMRNQCIAALTYPAIVFISSILVVLVIIKCVLPGFLPMFANFGMKLPLPTRILIGINDILSGWKFFVLLLLVVGCIVLWSRYMKTEKGKMVKDAIMLNIPVVNKIMSKIIMARFCRSFSLLYSSGLSFAQSMKLLEDIVDNAYYKEDIENALKNVSEGDTIAGALAKEHLFPRIVVNMIATGEDTGELPMILDSAAHYYEVDARNFLDNMSTILEPLIISILGVVVGFILFALLMPLYEMIGTFSGV